MSSTYNWNNSSVGVHSSRELELDDDLGLNINHLPNTPFKNNHLSPYNPAQSYSNSASPSNDIGSTPGESLSEFTNYQASEFSEPPDEFYGVNFDLARLDSFPSTIDHHLYEAADLDRPLPDLSTAEDNKRSSAALSTSTYPLSPVHSSTPNTPSPRFLTNDLKSQVTVTQHELIVDLQNSRYPQGIDSAHTQTSIQLTPDQSGSGSSHTSEEGIEPGTMQRDYPRKVAAPQRTTLPSQGNSNTYAPRDSGFEPSDNDYFGAHPSIIAGSQGALGPVERDDDGIWKQNAMAGPAGLSPEARRSIPVEEGFNINEMEEARRIDSKNSEVAEWRSKSSDSTRPEVDQSGQNGYFQGQSFFQIPDQHHQPAPEDQADIAPLEETIPTENQLKEGQTYFDFAQPIVSDADKQILNQPYLWNDAPSVPMIIHGSKYQPTTANDAITRFRQEADTISLFSRTATWGTRRKSEPSLAEWDAVVDGSFLRRLAITGKRDTGRASRPSNRFDQALAGLANIVRKKSDSKLKRARSSHNIPEEPENAAQDKHNSQGSLAPPPRRTPSFGKKTPSITTAFAAMAGPLAAVGNTHTRNGSISGPLVSPRSPHLGVSSIIGRNRSRSELSPHDKTTHGGIASLWRSTGGPPVPNITTPPEPPAPSAPLEAKRREVQLDVQDNEDDEDEEDDEQGDEEDSKIEPEVDPIVPNHEGFKAHVRRLNPDMSPQYNWLVSRVARQQEIRYKNLLEMRVRHSKAILSRNCPAGSHCISLGGRPTVMNAKGNRRESEPISHGLHPLTTEFNDDDLSDGSNLGEGAVTAETFPQGVPMPPIRNLPAEFECQLCFKAKKFQKPSDWTKHVHEDVQPFTCTYEKCKESKSFKRKADWVRHENERHRHLEWWTCNVDDCKHICYRKDNFLQHLVREHKLPEPKQKTKAAIKKARATEPAWRTLDMCHAETLSRPQQEPCKFCGKTFPTWKKLTVHLAKHMEHISLPILKLVEVKNVNADTIISPVEQILTPVTPDNRAKMESNSPFNMSGISPNPISSRPFQNSGFPPSPYLLQSAGSNNPYNLPQYSPAAYTMGTMFPQNDFNVQQQNQPRGFQPLDASMNHVPPAQIPVHGFPTMNPDFNQIKPEQSRGLDFGQSFEDAMADHAFGIQINPAAYSVPQDFSAPTAVSGFATTNMLGVHDPTAEFGFGSMTPHNDQNYQQIPMSRGHGSSSSYSHSPHPMPQNPNYY